MLLYGPRLPMSHQPVSTPHLFPSETNPPMAGPRGIMTRKAPGGMGDSPFPFPRILDVYMYVRCSLSGRARTTVILLRRGRVKGKVLGVEAEQHWRGTWQMRSDEALSYDETEGGRIRIEFLFSFFENPFFYEVEEPPQTSSLSCPSSWFVLDYVHGYSLH